MTNLLVKLFIKDRDNVKSPKVRYAYGMLGSISGICCNLFLFAVKLFAGLITGSIAIIADAINNLSDMGSSVVALLGIKLANKPADKDHPFGHGRMEYMSAFVVAALIILVGFELLKSSVQKIIHPQNLEITPVAFIILGASVLVKLWMSVFYKKLGRKIDSSVLCATSSDSVNDVISTLAIIISMAVQHFTGIPLDGYTGVAVALFILYSGYTLSKDALDPLLGAPPDADTICRIEEIIMSYEGFCGIHDLIVHNYGPGRCFASIHVEVPQDCDIVFCHEQIDACERRVIKETGVELVIHMDPIDTNDENLSQIRKALLQKITQIEPSLTIHDFRMTPKGAQLTNLIFDVVVPADFNMDEDEFKSRVEALARELDATYNCVITVDRDFTGK